MVNHLLTITHQMARITLQHPPANVLTLAILDELERAFHEVEDDPDVRVIIVTGAGRFFCAGADIKELAHLNHHRKGCEYAARGQALLNRIECFDKPVVAAINGTCVGGGLELALACHVRVAAAGVMMGLPEIKLGLIPGFGGTQRLPRVVGPSKATEMILSGESVTAEQAWQIGLVSRVVPSSDLMAQTETVARVMASHDPTTIHAALHAIRSALELPLAEGLAREAELFGQLCASREKQDAIRAFLEKRQPNPAGTKG
ncbi:MAG: enoyl-CoA hydratase-related protein [Nitrospiraceae bacterium]